MAVWTSVVQPCGGGTMNVHDIAPDGRIVGGSDMQGIYLTSNNGDSWQIRNRGLGAGGAYDNVAAIIWSKTESNTIYAGCGDAGSGGGLLVSTNGAGSWAPRTTAVQFAGNHTAAPLTSGGWPRSTGRLLVHDTSGTGFLYAATYKTGVKRSAAGPGVQAGADDFPVTYTFGGSAPGTNVYFCRCLWYDAPNDDLYTGQFSSGSSGGLWVCTSPHAASPNFVKMTAAPATVEDVAVLEDIIYVAAGDQGIYRSTNGGTTFTAINGTSIDTTGSHWNSLDVTMHPNGTSHLVACVCEGGLNVTGGDVSFGLLTVASHGTGAVTYQMLDPRNTNTAQLPPDMQPYWGGASGTCLGDNGGCNFHVRFDPNDDTKNTIFVSGSFGFYRSYDRGVHWQVAERGANQFPVRGPLACDPAHPNHVVMGDTDWGGFDIADGIGYANQAGSMLRSTVGNEGRAVACDPVDGTTYMAGGTKYSFTAGGCCKSHVWNAPTTWTDMNPPWAPKVATGLCAFRNASNTKILLAAVQISGVWWWDGSWHQSTPTSGGPFTGGQQPANTTFAYAGGGVVYIYDKNGGVFRSVNYGQSWTLIMTAADGAAAAGKLAQCQIAANPAVPGELWVSATSNLYKLSGANSGTVGSGITKTTISASAVSGGKAGAIACDADGVVYAATFDSGDGCDCLASSNGGTTWTTTQPDYSFAGNCDQPFRLAVAADGRLYALGSNNLQWTYPGTAPPPTLAVTTTSLPGGAVGTAYSAQLAATGGVPPYQWTVA